METFRAILAWLHRGFHWQDSLVGGLVEQLESQVCMRAISQSDKIFWRYVLLFFFVVVSLTDN